MKLRLLFGIVLVALFLLGTAPAAAEEAATVDEHYTARAMSMGTSNPPVLPPGQTATVDITVTRWTTPEERAGLLKALAEGGQPAMVRALQEQEETGWVRVTGSSATFRSGGLPTYRLRYSREIVGENGERRLVLALDRPISMYEARNRPRWRDHDVTMIVLDLPAEGTGEGQLAAGVQLDLNMEAGTLTIENFGSEPVRLIKVRRTK